MTITRTGDQKVVRVQRREDLPQALLSMGLAGPRPVLVSVGGAGGMPAGTGPAIDEFLTRYLVPLLDRAGVAVVDGGTDAGVMRAMGRARSALGARFPLIGVAAEGTVIVPGDPHGGGHQAPLEPNHTHTILVPGGSWGEESPWLSDVASALCGTTPSVTLLTNGGEISYEDATHSLESGRPLLVLAGTGRTADAIGDAAGGGNDDPRARAIAASPLTTVMPLIQPGLVLEAVASALRVPVR